MESKNTIYIDDFMTEEEEGSIKVPLPKNKDKREFEEKKKDFDLKDIVSGFRLHKELFIPRHKDDVHEYYEFTGEILGRGGFGVVHKVKLKETGQIRAAKQIPRAKIRNYDRFINEVSALKQ